MPSTYILVSSNVLSTATASVTFSALPTTFTDLVLRASVRGSDSGNNSPFRLKINADTGNNYSRTRLYSYDNVAYSQRATNEADNIDTAFFNLGTTTSNTFSNIEVYVPNYLSTTSKPISGSGVMENNATTAIVSAHAVLYRNSSAITSLQFFTNSGNFVAGSSFYLYGIKNS
jgi:hypothetical protein